MQRTETPVGSNKIKITELAKISLTKLEVNQFFYHVYGDCFWRKQTRTKLEIYLI